MYHIIALNGKLRFLSKRPPWDVDKGGDTWGGPCCPGEAGGGVWGCIAVPCGCGWGPAGKRRASSSSSLGPGAGEAGTPHPSWGLRGGVVGTTVGGHFRSHSPLVNPPSPSCPLCSSLSWLFSGPHHRVPVRKRVGSQPLAVRGGGMWKGLFQFISFFLFILPAPGVWRGKNI